MSTEEALCLEVTLRDQPFASVDITDRAISIGRHDSNQLVLGDMSVSRHHALASREGRDLVLMDLHSKSGTHKGTERIQRVTLKVGESVQIGPYSLRLATKSTPPEATEEADSKVSPELRELGRIDGALAKLSALVGITDQQAVLDTLLERAMGMVHGNRGFVVLCHDGGLVPVAGGSEAAENELFSRTVCQRAQASKRPILLTTDGKDQPMDAIASLYARSLKLVLAVPLIHQEDVLGILYIEGERTSRHDEQQLAEVLSRVSDLGGRALRAALEKNQIIGENEQWRWLASVLSDHPDIFRTSKSAAMRDVLKLVKRSAAEDVTVLLRGESGTGKEITALTIHRLSARATAPFTAINCGAIPRDLVESELFGHERGAFTGANEAKPGRLELSQGGTLLLDEIGDLPRDLQVKLLRVLETRTFERLGGRKTIRWTGRLLAATHTDLEAAIARKEFREDLYFRINVVSIELPPLRKRLDDLVPLVHELLLLTNRKFKRKLYGVDEDALYRMQSYHWPGNIRELRNAIERAFIIEESEKITAASLPFLRNVAVPAVPGLAAHESLPTLLEFTAHNERAYLEFLLKRVHGNVTHAARILGIARASLQRKLKHLGMRGQLEAAEDDAEGPEADG